MHPTTHFLVGWLTANAGGLNRRERAIVTLVGIAPDLDGFGAIVEVATKHSAHPLLWWSNYHHTLGHNVFAGLACAVAAFALSTKRWWTALLALLSFHLHLLCDVIGARGPDGDQWPIPYLWPVTNAWQWAWEGQWKLNAWPNFVITGVALALMFYLACRRGYSPVELISPRADSRFVETLRARFSRRTSQKESGFPE